MNESWEMKQHSWREIGIYSPTRQITMIDIENSFDVSEYNQDECERLALQQANLIAAAPDLLGALEAVNQHLCYGISDTIDALKDISNAAISKAKGEV